MGFVNEDFFNELNNDYINRANQSAQKQTTAVNENLKPPFERPGIPATSAESPILQNQYATPSTPVRTQGDISEEEQIKKFGAPVGSKEYFENRFKTPYRTFLPMQLGSSILGMEFPDITTWDKMSTTDKIGHTTAQALAFPVKLAFGLPAFVIKSIPSIGAAVVNAALATAPGSKTSISNMILGKSKPSELLGELKKQEEENKILFTDPIWSTANEYYKQAKDSGKSETVSNAIGYAMAGVEIFNRALVGRGFYQATKSLIVPPKRLIPGETISEVAPIQEAITATEKKYGPKKSESASSYLSIDKTAEKNIKSEYGVSGGRLFMKVTPASEGSVEISLIQNTSDIMSKIKSKIGLGDENLFAGLYGKEKKLESHIVKVETPKQQPTEIKPFVSRPDFTPLENMRLELQNLDDVISQHPAFSLTKYATNKKTELPEVIGLTKTEKAVGKKVGEYGKRGDEFITELGFESSEEAARSYEQLVKLRDKRATLKEKIKNEKTKIGEVREKALEEESLKKSIELESQIDESLNKIKGAILKPIPDQPLKGFENAPIRSSEIENIFNISRFNGMEPAITESVISMMTGKKVVGDLTRAEYINVVKTISSMNKMGEFTAGGQASLWSKFVGQYISPAYSWMDSVQRKTGIPLRDAHLDLRKSIQIQKTTQQAYFGEIENIFGKYAERQFTDERRAISAYMDGDFSAIEKNPNFSPQTKSDLLNIINGENGLASFYEKSGIDLNVPKEIYKKNSAGYYLPKISDIRGIIPKYKIKGEIPTVGEFFAKQKKYGGVYIAVDDAMQLAQTYARDGSYKKFVKPVVERIKSDIEPNVPKEFKNSFSSTISEMLGHEGKFEEFLDNVSMKINKFFNKDFSPDLGRKVNQAIFSYAYVNALDSPGTWTRNILTNEGLIYTKFGAEFYPQIKGKILNKAAWEEFRKSGMANDKGLAYGADIGTTEGTIKNVSEFLLTPQSMSDNLGRFYAYWGTKIHFENALKLYNEGKLNWKQVEKKLDLEGIDYTTAQRVRNYLVKKDVKSAFEELARANIDETNFPYIRGEGGRLTFGEAGHIGTFLAKWNIHFSHNVGRWIRTGQFDKLLRYYTASTAIVESLKQSMGTDFTRSFYFGPVANVGYPPTVEIIKDLVGSIQGITMDNAEAIDESRESLVKNLKTFGLPGGVMTKNFQDFWRSYNNGPVDSEGRYYIIGEKGDIREKEPVYFHDLFWRMWGMPTTSKVESSEVKKEMIKYSYEINSAKRKVAELRNAGKDDEADKIVLEWESKGEDIEPGKQSYERFEVPQLERMFEKLPAGGKERFESKIFGE